MISISSLISLTSFFLALPLGQFPVLKIDGVMYCQTQAINAYCGKLAKLPALSDIEELKNHMINETTNEVFEAMVKPSFAAAAVQSPADFGKN